MKLGIELTPSRICLLGESKGTKWTALENKMFENALAVCDEDMPNRWHCVAAMIPGKTAGDVILQYKELEEDINSIEAGNFPVCNYNFPFTLESGNGCFDGLNHSPPVRKRPSSDVRSDIERKKGIPWTEDEHKLFLLGLKKYGKGDWRNISRNFVITRTPTQVASHAQKYFIRQLPGGKDKRRASIHDITTADVKSLSSPENQYSTTNSSAVSIQRSQCGNILTSPRWIDSIGVEVQGHDSFLV